MNAVPWEARGLGSPLELELHYIHYWNYEISRGCWESNLGPLEAHQVFFFFFFKDLFIMCKYTVAVFRHSRRGSQISLRMVVSHLVVAGIWTRDLWKISRVLLPAEPSHQPTSSVLNHWAVFSTQVISNMKHQRAGAETLHPSLYRALEVLHRWRPQV
jgi:hypothetical protein